MSPLTAAGGRWPPRRKAALVAAIDRGEMTSGEAAARYGLSPEELALWRDALASHGVPGLRVTRIQIYKQVTRQ